MSQIVEKSIEEFLHLDSDVDDFIIKPFFLVHRYISNKVSMKTETVVFHKKLLTGR